jgi:V8-like Glu-specific endopeptidase
MNKKRALHTKIISDLQVVSPDTQLLTAGHVITEGSLGPCRENAALRDKIKGGRQEFSDYTEFEKRPDE